MRIKIKRAANTGVLKIIFKCTVIIYNNFYTIS